MCHTSFTKAGSFHLSIQLEFHSVLLCPVNVSSCYFRRPSVSVCIYMYICMYIIWLSFIIHLCIKLDTYIYIIYLEGEWGARMAQPENKNRWLGIRKAWAFRFAPAKRTAKREFAAGLVNQDILTKPRSPSSSWNISCMVEHHTISSHLRSLWIWREMLKMLKIAIFHSQYFPKPWSISSISRFDCWYANNDPEITR